jgi:RimJ/RimL family protein N-acetyltransferase
MGLQHSTLLFHALDYDSVYDFIPNQRPINSGEVTARISRVLAGPGGGSAEIWLNFVVFLDDEIIGRLEATIVNSWAEIAFLFDPTYSGKGYATEGTLWLIDHICKSYQIAEFWATTDPNNLKSIQLLLRCGFKNDSLPKHGIRSYDEGDSIFRLRQSPDPSDNMTP